MASPSSKSNSIAVWVIFIRCPSGSTNRRTFGSSPKKLFQVLINFSKLKVIILYYWDTSKNYWRRLTKWKIFWNHDIDYVFTALTIVNLKLQVDMWRHLSSISLIFYKTHVRSEIFKIFLSRLRPFLLRSKN